MGNLVQKPQNNSTFTCQICIEPFSVTEQFNNNGKCKHPFCLDCVAKYVQAKIKDKSTGGNILCPGFYCKNRLDPSDCRELIISEKLFVEWCDLIFESSIPWENSSYCPNTNCMELVVNECGGGTSVTKSKCPNCKEFFCFQCKTKWEEISDYKHKCIKGEKLGDINDFLFMRLMKTKKWVKCPGCGHCIERIEGCNNFQCTRCSTSFCYGCGRRRCTCNNRFCYTCERRTCTCVDVASFCDECRSRTCQCVICDRCRRRTCRCVICDRCRRRICICKPKIEIPYLLILMSTPVLFVIGRSILNK